MTISLGYVLPHTTNDLPEIQTKRNTSYPLFGLSPRRDYLFSLRPTPNQNKVRFRALSGISLCGSNPSHTYFLKNEIMKTHEIGTCLANSNTLMVKTYF